MDEKKMEPNNQTTREAQRLGCDRSPEVKYEDDTSQEWSGTYEVCGGPRKSTNVTGHAEEGGATNVGANGKAYMRCANHARTPVTHKQVASIDADIAKLLKLTLAPPT